jgi:type I restriction enzyme, S subunit
VTGLPPGWIASAVGAVVEPYENVDPTQQPTEEFRYIDIGSIDNIRRCITTPKALLGKDAPSRARRVVATNDVLFSTVRTYLKNIAFVPPSLDRALTSTGISVLRACGAVDPGYLFEWVCSDAFVDSVSRSQDGTMYPAVSDSDVLKETILLPPLAEQHRIVAKLDALSACSKRARAELDRVIALCSAAAKAKMVSEIERVATTASTAEFGDILEILTSGSRGWAHYYDQGDAVFVLAANVKPLRFDPSPLQCIGPPLSTSDARRSRKKKDDLLLTMRPSANYRIDF